MEAEEAAAVTSTEVKEEVEALTQEAELSQEDFLAQFLPPGYLEQRDQLPAQWESITDPPAVAGQNPDSGTANEDDRSMIRTTHCSALSDPVAADEVQTANLGDGQPPANRPRPPRETRVVNTEPMSLCMDDLVRERERLEMELLREESWERRRREDEESKERRRREDEESRERRRRKDDESKERRRRKDDESKERRRREDKESKERRRREDEESKERRRREDEESKERRRREDEESRAKVLFFTKAAAAVDAVKEYFERKA
ncbi:unnamed protein product [Cyprideis torosa]|uniref:Uncharacterized protein n=1 Tax=Cyprideis torosa TaxID=163714 RepID=A0A7R8W4V5_9CRUS|nr:unnamed protein product [Cyprideis torosa]CAG0884639.1 unnamed protein product [Cyprideis torosa]